MPIGSNFDDFLKEEGLYEQTTAAALKKVLALQIEEGMKTQQLTKTAMAKRMRTSRAAFWVLRRAIAIKRRSSFVSLLPGWSTARFAQRWSSVSKQATVAVSGERRSCDKLLTPSRRK